VGHSNLAGVDGACGRCDFGGALLARANSVCAVVPAISAGIDFLDLDLSIVQSVPGRSVVLAASLDVSDNLEHPRAIRRWKEIHHRASGPFLSTCPRLARGDIQPLRGGLTNLVLG